MNAKFHIDRLKAGLPTQFRPHGHSMTGRISNGQLVTFEPVPDTSVLQEGDIVMCKVKGRVIDAHLISAIRPDGAFQISNNHGYVNGWTRTIYGRVIKVED